MSMRLTRARCIAANSPQQFSLQETLRAVRAMGIFSPRQGSVHAPTVNKTSSSLHSPHVTHCKVDSMLGALSTAVPMPCVTNFVADPLKPFSRSAWRDVAARSVRKRHRRLQEKRHSTSECVTTSCSGSDANRSIYDNFDGCYTSVYNSAHVEGIVQSIQISPVVCSSSHPPPAMNDMHSTLQDSNSALCISENQAGRTSMDHHNNTKGAACNDSRIAFTWCTNTSVNQDVDSAITAKSTMTRLPTAAVTWSRDLFLVQILLAVRDVFPESTSGSASLHHGSSGSNIAEESAVPIAVRGYMTRSAIERQVGPHTTQSAHVGIGVKLHASGCDSSNSIEAHKDSLTGTNDTDERKNLIKGYHDRLTTSFLQQCVIVSGELRMMHIFDDQVRCVVDVPFIHLPYNALPSHCRTVAEQ